MSDILSRPSWRIQPASAVVTSDELKLFVVGFAARDASKLLHHVEELRSHGVTVPKRIPVIWTIDADLLNSRAFGRTPNTHSSGEVEPVLLRLGGRWMLTVGSDHTDRLLERRTLVGSKRACPKPVSGECWSLDDVRDRWDSLLLRSWIRRDDEWVLYQEGLCAEVQPAEWYVEQIERRRPVGDCVVFCGTVPTVQGLQLGAEGFRGELEDPTTGLRVRCEYLAAELPATERAIERT